MTIEDYAAAQAAVRWPSVALLVLALLNCVPIASILYDASRGAVGFDVEFALVLAVITTLASGAIIFAAINMRSLWLYPLAIMGSVLAMLPCHLMFLFGIPLGVWSLRILTRHDVREAFRVRLKLLPLLGVAESEQDELLGPPLSKSLAEAFAVSLVPAVFAMILIYGVRARESRPATVATPTKGYGHGTTMATKSVELPQESLVWKNGEPQIGPRLRALNALTNDQIATLNETLAKVYRDYAKIEQEHTTRSTNDAGHQVIKVGAFRKDLTRLEDEFWTAADAVVVNDGIRGILREELKFPGNIFHYGSSSYEVEMWRSGAWYYLQDQYNRSTLGSELPPRYRRLWPAEAPPKAE